MFKCDMCGECCRNIRLSPLYSELDDGTGACRYLVGNKCSIYSARPLLCRVDESYEAFFSEAMTKEEYYRLNYEACENLKKNRRNRRRNCGSRRSWLWNPRRREDEGSQRYYEICTEST